jgi:methionyl-tRNA formyltransferase
MLKSFYILISNTSRSLAYLDILKNNKIFPNQIVYLDNCKKTKISKKLKKNNFFFPNTKLKVFKADKINKKVANFLSKSKEKNLIYSGYPGEIIKSKKILMEKNVIHCHPGKLPDFRGSTTIYYSLLKHKKIYCTTLLLDKKIDHGKILLKKKYPVPKNIFAVDGKYDDLIRSKNLLYALKNFKKLKSIRQKKNDIIPYYVIHPVLRSIAFKNNYKKYK